jgi:hypothetical protein
MPDTLDEGVVSSVAIGNLKAISEQPAMLSNLAYSNVVSTNNLGQQNAVANQQAMNELGISVIAKGSNTVSDLGPMEARSAVDILTNNELAETIADLKATMQAFAGPGGGAARGGKGGGGWLAKLKALIGSGVSVNGQGYLVVPPGTTVIFPGSFGKENVQVTLENDGVVVKVTPLLT